MDKTRFRTSRSIVNLRQGRTDWYSIRNLTSASTQVNIYDEIGYFGITAKDFINDLTGIKGPIDLHLNTPGGEVFDGIAIYNALKQHGDVSIVIDSLAASIGSVIAMAASPGKLSITKNASMMIHDGFGMVVGNAGDMRETADLLDKTSDNIASIYADRTGKPAGEWRELMLAETWFIGQEAVDAGLADRIHGADDATASRRSDALASFDLSIFRKQPHNATDGDSGDGYEPEPYHAEEWETVQCPGCQKMNDDDAQYCGQCGQKLTGRTDVTETPMQNLLPQNTATGVHHTATEDSTWDGPAAEAAMPNDADTLKYCHAWYDSSGDPDVKSTYKFPHHRTKGGPANLPACRNGLARLSGAHIPDSDKTGVKAHLQAHLDDAEKKNQANLPYLTPDVDFPLDLFRNVLKEASTS